MTKRSHQTGVDLSDLSHSYPFLDLSRRLGVEYKLVLAIADSIDREDDGYRPWYEYEVWSAVHLVCRAPWRWQFPPVGRGL